MDDDDRTAAILAGIRERSARVAAANLNADAFGGGVYAPLVRLASEDTPRLVAAVKAVLKLADSSSVRQQVYLPGPVTQPISWDLDPAKIREAIAAALTGEEAGDEH